MAGAIETLRSKTLRMSSPTLFTDPLDCNWDAYWQLNHPDWIERIREHAAKMIVGGRMSHKKFRNRTIRESFYQTRASILKRKSPLDSAREHIRQLQDSFSIPGRDQWLADLKQIRAKMRIFCFSNICTSLSMWSQYAEKNSGVVIGFYERALNWHKGHFRGDVQYVSAMPPVLTIEQLAEPYHYLTAMPSMSSILRALVYTKSSDWEYEKEYRIFGADFKSTPVYLHVPFTTPSLAHIILGERCSASNKKIITTLAENLSPNLEIYQVANRPDRLALDPFAITVRGK
jgi:hypothetical protein